MTGEGELLRAVRRANARGEPDGVRVEPGPGELASALRAELEAITDAVVRMEPRTGAAPVDRGQVAQQVHHAYLAGMSDPALADLGVQEWRRVIAGRVCLALSFPTGDPPAAGG